METTGNGHENEFAGSQGTSDGRNVNSRNDEASDGLANSQIHPPHAAPRRQLVEDPLATVERLIADQVSGLTNEQRWDTYGEIDDHVATEQAKTSMLDRLSASCGHEIAVWLDSDFGNGQAITGELLEVGTGWCQLAQPSGAIVINTDGMVQLRNLAAGKIASPAARSWASIIRALAVPAHVLTIWTRSGRVLNGTLNAAYLDHLELIQATEASATVIPYRQIAVIR